MCLCGIVLASAVSAQERLELKLGFWGSADDEKADLFAINGIEKAVPGVSIKLMKYPSDAEFWDYLPAQIAAGTAPELVVITNERYLEYIQNGLIMSLDPKRLDLRNIPQSSIDVWTVGGKLYGLPVASAPACFFVNMDMWHAAGLKDADLPKTWDDVKKAAKILTKDGVKGLCINDSEFHLTQYAQSFGGGWGEGKTIDSEANAKALDFIIDMFGEGLAVTPKQVGESWDGAVFSARKAAMTTGGVWYAGHLASTAPDMHYKAIPIPQADPKNAAFSLHSTAFVVLKNSKNMQQIEKVLSYMGRKDYEQFTMKQTGALPANAEVAKAYFKDHPQFAGVQKLSGHILSFGYPADAQRFANALINALDSVIYTKGSSKEGKDLLADIVKQLQSAQ
jgi:ABC-type sugar transport system, periplasmic component